MFNSFLSQLLVLLLIFISCIRIFFTKKSKIDSAAVIAPVAFLASIFNIYVWNAATGSTIIAALAFLVFLTNIRSLFRLSARLYVDTYSIRFYFFSILELLAAVAFSVMLILCAPVRIDQKDFNATEEISRLNGSLENGFVKLEKNQISGPAKGFLHIYKPAEDSENLPVILLCGTADAEVSDYVPYILFLVKRGFTVVAADFYSDDICWTSKTLFNKRYFRKRISLRLGGIENKEAHVNSYKALTEIAKKMYDRQFYYVFDKLDYDSIFEITDDCGSQSLGFFCLNRIPEYKSAGYGFVEQTNIIQARKYGLSKDKTLFIPRYVAGKTHEEIKLLLPAEEKPVEETENSSY